DSLTRAVRQIERGNLDVAMPVQSQDELGELARAVVAMAAQLRELRKAEHDRLVRTERTTQLAIDSMPDAVVVVDARGGVELSNAAARRFGVEPGRAIDAGGTELAGRLAALHRRAMTQDTAGAESYESAIQLVSEGRPRFFLPRAA